MANVFGRDRYDVDGVFVMERRGRLVIVARRIPKATILELGLPRRANPDLA
jgi:hypothetical protein